MTPIALKVIRPVFGLGGRYAPKLTARLAFELFCRTPSRRPAGPKARQAHAEGRRRLASAETMPFHAGKARVMAYRLSGGSRETGKRFLVAHGWGSSAAYISTLAAGLASAGDEVVVLDFPGHGLSGGRRLNMRMAVEAIVEAERRFGPFDGAVGHSFGGASLMLAAGGIMSGIEPFSPGRLAVIGAPSRIEWLFEDFADVLGLSEATRRGLVRHAETVAGAALSDFDCVPIAHRLGERLLVVHAEDDKEVDADHARRFATVPDVNIHWANGHGHRRIIGVPEVIGLVSDFLKGVEDEGSRCTAA